MSGGGGFRAIDAPTKGLQRRLREARQQILSDPNINAEERERLLKQLTEEQIRPSLQGRRAEVSGIIEEAGETREKAETRGKRFRRFQEERRNILLDRPGRRQTVLTTRGGGGGAASGGGSLITGL